MNKIILFLGILLAVSCTKDNFIDTGLANGLHDCSMYEYMKNDLSNWDSTVVLINHAGLKDMFDGKDQAHPEFTFFGVTKLSIIRYLEMNKKEQIADLDPEICKKMLMGYVLKDVLKKEDIPAGERGKTLPIPPFFPYVPGEGGLTTTSEGGKKFRIYTYAEDYGGVTGAGAVYLYLESGSKLHDIASADIQFTNGVIHSLHYKHTFGSL